MKLADKLLKRDRPRGDEPDEQARDEQERLKAIEAQERIRRQTMGNNPLL